MITISLCMIVKNEEATLSCCLDSVCDITDEIIIIDTGSSDATKEIAGRYTDKVYDFPWSDDFAEARNVSFSKATCDFCLWLDADDVLLEPDRAMLKTLKENLSLKTDFVMCRYHTGFDSNGIPVFSYYRERLIRNHRGYTWQGAVHEAVTPTGEILYTDIAVTHTRKHPSDPKRNLRIFQGKLAKGQTLDSREQFYYARELFYTGDLIQAISYLKSFLNMEDGWLENKIEACRILANCYFIQQEDEQAIMALLQSFLFDKPRAEICCDLGNYFISQEKYKQACFWYQIAADCQREDQTGGFVETDCYGYIPNLQLCLCQEKMGNRQAACQFNEKAGKFKPDGKEYLHNKEFFQRLGWIS